MAVGHPSYGRLSPRHPDYRESGAVLVGAGSSATVGGRHQRLCFSNYGERLDSHAWGENVFTLGYGPALLGVPCGGPTCANPFPAGTFNEYYTACFSGTSSAAPIVTGALSILQAAHFAQFNVNLQPAAARALLRTTGTPAANPTLQPMGNQPDLKEQLGLLALGPDVAHVQTGSLNQSGSGSFLGWSVAAAGDTDGDGVSDYLVGAPFEDTGLPLFAGRADLVSGRTGSVLWPLAGNGVNDNFGYAVAGLAGDVDGDGLPEVLVSAPLEDNGPLVDAGAVYVISGFAGATLRVHRGQSMNEQLGIAIDGSGDLDGDGCADVIAGSLNGNVVRVFSGALGTLMHNLTGTGGQFGLAVHAVPDVNADNFDDVLVGEPLAQGQGTVHLFCGVTGTSLRQFPGTAAGDEFGHSVAGLADQNGDGAGEVLVSAWKSDTTALDGGEVLLYSGGTGQLIRSHAGTVAGEQIGTDVASAGDFDGDGVDDYIVGSELASSAGPQAGEATVYSGASGSLVRSYSGRSNGGTGWFLGHSVSGAGDLNGDGRDDVLVGAPLAEDASGANVGRAASFLAPPTLTGAPGPSLILDIACLSATFGGTSNLSLNAGAAQAGKLYVIFAGVTGSSPGSPLPTGGVVPLNWDLLTPVALRWSLSNLPPFTNFVGNLDALGNAAATFGAFGPGQLTPALGIQFTLAAATSDFAWISNPLTISVLP
jgi:hypothetical protein